MKIKMRYENAYQTIEVETQKLEKWLDISITEDESESDYEKRIQEEIDVKYNRPDYNNWHGEYRHVGSAKCKGKEGVVEVNTEEAIMLKATNKSVFTKDIDDLVERIHHECQYEHYCNYLRSILKPDAAEMVIAIILDGLSVGEYAASIGDKANNVSHRYRRAIKKLKKVFQKTSF